METEIAMKTARGRFGIDVGRPDTATQPIKNFISDWIGAVHEVFSFRVEQLIGKATLKLDGMFQCLSRYLFLHLFWLSRPSGIALLADIIDALLCSVCAKKKLQTSESLKSFSKRIPPWIKSQVYV